MTEISRVWNGSGGSGDDGSYSATDWSNTWFGLAANGALSNAGDLNRGIIKGVLNDLEVAEQAVPNATVQVKTGEAFVQGIWYKNDVAETMTPAANASGSTRYDIIVLRADYTTLKVRLAIRQGTAGAGLPALQQAAGGVWEIPLAYLELVSGYTTISNAEIFDMREIANSYEQLYAYVQNKSGGVLEAGDTVIWDGSNNQAVTTSTIVGDNVAGIVQGRIAANDYGRILRKGYGLVRVDTAVARGDRLSKSNAAAKAGFHGGIRFARAMLAGAVDTRVLSYVDVVECHGGRTEWHRLYDGIAATAPTGAVVAANNTVGDGSSGSTTASTETRSLFRQLWDNSSNTYLAILTSGGAPSVRGADADTDFDAHKRMPVPDMRGNVAVGLDNLGGTPANRITAAVADNIAGAAGAETHTLITAELPSHAHDILVDTSGTTGGGTNIAGTNQPTDATGTTEVEGGGTAHNNLPPYVALGKFINL